MRAYLPCLSHAYWESADRGADAADQVAIDGQAAVNQGSTDGKAAVAALNNSPISCLALIALRDLKDEELLLNYRCPSPPPFSTLPPGDMHAPSTLYAAPPPYVLCSPLNTHTVKFHFVSVAPQVSYKASDNSVLPM